jgi:hypothetical protein
MTAACIMSSRWMRSYKSAFEWWVRDIYSTGSCMHWNPGMPTESNDS